MSTSSSDHSAVSSPFESSRAEVTPNGAKSKRSWIVLGLITLIVLGVSGGLLVRYLAEPLRTLEVLPVDKYFSGYEALRGAKFKGRLRVESDLGFRPDHGRLMVFSSESDPRPLVVLIPANLAGQYFTKGQFYLMQLDVREGGIIYANTCVKN